MVNDHYLHVWGRQTGPRRKVSNFKFKSEWAKLYYLCATFYIKHLNKINKTVNQKGNINISQNYFAVTGGILQT